MKSSNETLVAALRILANDIKSPDDVPALCLREAADRIEELAALREVTCIAGVGLSAFFAMANAAREDGWHVGGMFKIVGCKATLAIGQRVKQEPKS